MWSLRVVVVLLCSSLNDDLCRLNLVLNSFSVSPMYVSCFFVSVSVTVALYTTHLVRHFPSSGQLFYIYIYIYITKTKGRHKMDDPRNFRPNGREKKSQSRHTEIQMKEKGSKSLP